MKLDDIKIALIGCGNIADTHVASILESLDGAIVSVCDPLPRVVKQWWCHLTTNSSNRTITVNRKLEIAN